MYVSATRKYRATMVLMEEQKPMKELALVASMEAEQPIRGKCVRADSSDLKQHQGLDKTHKELV